MPGSRLVDLPGDGLAVNPQPVRRTDGRSAEGLRPSGLARRAPMRWPIAALDIVRFEKSSPWTFYGSFAVLALLLRLACTTGLVGSDDLYYSKYAAAMADGHYARVLAESRGVEHVHHSLRFGVIVPLALIYRIAGISEWTTIILPLAASTACVLLLVAIGTHMFGRRVGLIAGLLYATFPIQLQFATVLEPEPIAECFVLLGVLTYLHARQGATGWCVLAGALMGAAYLTKEAAVFIGGAFFLHAVWERRWRGAALFALGLSGVIALELTYYWWQWGDILFRPHSTQLYTLGESDSFFVPRRNLGYRLFKKYPEAMLLPGWRLGLHSVATIIGAALAWTLRPRSGYGMLALWAVLPWLYLNFGSWSIEQYAPLPAAPRYLEFTYPPLMLLTAITLSRAFRLRAAIARPVAAVFALVLCVGFAASLGVRGTISQAHHMSVLREMVREAQASPEQTIHTDVKRWRMALAIFDARLISQSPETATFVLTRDPLGMPSIARRAGAGGGAQ